ncbi:MAG: hypothetical protein ACRD0A_06435 [Acidimicrobiales bacterium]
MTVEGAGLRRVSEYEQATQDDAHGPFEYRPVGVRVTRCSVIVTDTLHTDLTVDTCSTWS